MKQMQSALRKAGEVNVLDLAFILPGSDNRSKEQDRRLELKRAFSRPFPPSTICRPPASSSVNAHALEPSTPFVHLSGQAHFAAERHTAV